MLEGKTWEAIKSKIVNGINIIKAWLDHNKLYLNIFKTIYLHSVFHNCVKKSKFIIEGENIRGLKFKKKR